jgi:hypothetical protein
VKSSHASFSLPALDKVEADIKAVEKAQNKTVIAVFVTFLPNIFQEKPLVKKIKDAPGSKDLQVFRARPFQVFFRVIIDFVDILFHARAGKVIIESLKFLAHNRRTGRCGQRLVLRTLSIAQASLLKKDFAMSELVGVDARVPHKVGVIRRGENIRSRRLCAIQHCYDLPLKLRTQTFVAVHANDPVAVGLIHAKIEVAEDVSLAREIAAIRVALDNLARAVGGVHINHNDFITPAQRLKSPSNDLFDVFGRNYSGDGLSCRRILLFIISVFNSSMDVENINEKIKRINAPAIPHF